MAEQSVSGIVKQIGETETFGSNGFRKRTIRITTEEQYPQVLELEFVQDKVEILNNYNVGDQVKIDYNLRGREHEDRCFVNLQGWKIIKTGGQASSADPLA